MRQKIFSLITLLAAAGVLSVACGEMSYAKAASEKNLSRGELAVMLSTTNFMKEKVGGLLNFTTGYNLFSLNRATMAPIIRNVKVSPVKLPPDGRTIFNIYASIDDPGGASQILEVNADVSNIGKLSSMSLVDNGLWGDESANDGVYTLQTSPSPKVTPGEKELSVSVANKKGWLSTAKASVVIDKNPVIMSAGAVPPVIKPDGKTKIIFTVKIENPGRIEDITSVTINLSPIGGPYNVALRDDGLKADKKALDKIFSAEYAPPPGTSSGRKSLQVSVTNMAGGAASRAVSLQIAQ